VTRAAKRVVEPQYQDGVRTQFDMTAGNLHRQIGALALAKANTELRKAKLVLANLLSIPATEADKLTIRLDADQPADLENGEATRRNSACV
jgi:hypothetical protein